MPPTAVRELDSHQETQAIAAARAATVLFFLNGLVIGSWIPRMAELRDNLGVTEDILGRSLMGMGLGGLAGSLAGGIVANRVGTRSLSLVFGVVLLAALPVIAIVGSPWAFFGLLLVIGLTDAGVDIGMNAQVVHANDILGRNNINRVHAVWSVGSLVGGLIGTGAIAIGIDFLVQLLVVSALGLLSMVWVAPRLLRFDAMESEDVKRGSIGAVAVILGLAALATAVLEGTSTEWSPLVLADERGASDYQAALGFVVFSSAMLVVRLLADTVVARVGARNTMIGGTLILALGVAVIVFANDVPLTLVGYLLSGVGVAPLFPLLYLAAARNTENGAGTGLAVMSAGMRIGFLGAPVLIGAIATASSLSTAIGIVLGIALAVSLLHALQLPR